ncbi:MAG: hypothetical protein M3R13_09005 [Armatimonadota bacterium]|nr:hypothetical protein [Armatimonadota bacterium]
MTFIMRHILAGFAALLAGASVAQDQPVLLSGRPDVIVHVRKSDIGADYVRIQALDANYPQELLRSQIEAIGRYNESQIRGLEVSYAGSGGSGRILSATFATDRLMDQAANTLELNAFAKAFAGAPAPNTVGVIAVMYETFTPSESVTVAQWADKNVEVSSHYDGNLKVVDYRIKLLSQNPEEVSIPTTIAESTKRSETTSNKGFNPWLVTAIVAGAALLGLLVYFALRPRALREEDPGQEKR